MTRAVLRAAIALATLTWPAMAWAQAPPVENPGIPNRVQMLEQEVAELKATVASLLTRVADVEANEALKLSQYLEVTTDAELGNPLIRFSGVNVQLVSGAGAATTLHDLSEPSVNGKGNLIIGYNESCVLGGKVPVCHVASRVGSHNLVIGPLHGYSAAVGLVAGRRNNTTGHYSSVSAGYNNTASADYSSVSAGYNNTAGGSYSSVSGGLRNVASGTFASVSAGELNTARGMYSSVSAGYNNTASADYSSVSAGNNNTAGGSYSSVSGGLSNVASAYFSSVSAGYNNTASAIYSSVSGGAHNTASWFYSSVSGGASNNAGGLYSSVSGGQNQTAGDYSWAPFP